ncbi:MAG TPA: hypothetical protein VGG41_00435 [Solirubrobacteraceae bacterium]|jgi:hypothetical protein
MNDFRDRFGDQLEAAAAALAAAGSQADFRTRFGVQLAAAAGELAAAHTPAGAGAPLAGVRQDHRLRLPARARRSLSPRFGLGLSDFRVRFGLQLAAAAAELAGRRLPSTHRRRRTARWPWLTRPVVVGLILAAFAGTAFAAVAIWTPLLGNPQYGYSPGAATSAPPADQLAALGVLRRPQTDADRGALSTAALTYINDYTKGVRTAYVRLLATIGGEAFVLVPVEERDAASPGGAAPTASAPLTNAVCVYVADASTTHEHAACWSLAEVLAGTAWAQFDGLFYGLAPDGDSAATLTSVGGTPISAPISSNLFVITLPPSNAPLLNPSVSFTGG